MHVTVLYEDADVVAVSKPAGMLTHADGRSQEKTAEDWFKDMYLSPDAPDRPYVHRLDRETSGVLVFAKNVHAYDFVRGAFTKREVKKTYLAVVYGALKEKKGVIDFDIGRSRKDFRLRSAQPKAKGKLREAITRYEVIGELEDVARDLGEVKMHVYSLLELHPETGRTHQIRVHLKAIHHPIVGDLLYAPALPKSEAVGNTSTSFGTPKRVEDLGLGRLALHAWRLDLPLPAGGRVEIVAPLPLDFKALALRFNGVSELFAAK